MDTDKLSLNLKDHPEWQAALAGASPGDTITLKEVTVVLDELAEDMAIGSIEDCEGITVKPGADDDEEGDDSGTGEASEEATSPVLSVMAPGYKKKY